MDYIEYNVSQIAREFGLSGTNLGRQLRTHYPEVLESRERVRQRLGLDDGLPRGTRTMVQGTGREPHQDTRTGHQTAT